MAYVYKNNPEMFIAFENYADNLEEIIHQIQNMSEGQKVLINIEQTDHHDQINCSLLNSHPINVRKPYMLQAVLKCIIDNALKKLMDNQSAKAELHLTSCVSENYYTINVFDSGGPFEQETIDLLKLSQTELLTWMKDRLEDIENLKDDIETQKEFEGLPVGLGLPLSRLILQKLYRGDVEISNQPKSVTVKGEI